MILASRASVSVLVIWGHEYPPRHSASGDSEQRVIMLMSAKDIAAAVI